MFKFFALSIHIILHISFVVIVQLNLFVILSIILHVLCFINNPQCYQNHCTIYNNNRKDNDKIMQEKLESSRTDNIQPEQMSPKLEQRFSSQEQYSEEEPKARIQKYLLDQCIECGLAKWIRMHHCYRCKTCIHKYDHHCILLGLCIGERNQKFYVVFLWVYFYACFRQLIAYFFQIEQHIWMDWESGKEFTDWAYTMLCLLVIFFFIATIIVIYLACFHTYLAFYNDTTYQRRKRFGISYLRGVKKIHPFDEGVLRNFKFIFMDAGSEPIKWWNPSQNSCIGKIKK